MLWESIYALGKAADEIEERFAADTAAATGLEERVDAVWEQADAL